MKRTNSVTLAIAFACAAIAAVAQATQAGENQYAGQQQRAIKALSEQEIADYLNGSGMGTSKAAELNHYPGPRHVLELERDLRLTPEQVERTHQIQGAMAVAAKRAGRRIVDKEAELEALYAGGAADAANTRHLVRELGALQAEFRLVHLDAHLTMHDVLNAEQIAAYDMLRGYASGTNPAHGGHKH